MTGAPLAHDGIVLDLNERGQLDLLGELTTYKSEYDALPRRKTSTPHQFHLDNGMFGPVDAEVLYAMIRHVKPARILEIGSGSSTYLAAQAIRTNQERDGRPGELTAVEPHPNDVLRRGFPGLTRLVTARAQDIPLTEFARLQAGDILFIDSSHVLKIGGDVQHEFLEVLPRLNPGVLVHVHDVFLPAEYRREFVLGACRFWTEQYLLQAFLCFNDHYAVLWGSSLMHLRHPDALQAAFASYRPAAHWPASFWLRRLR